MKRDESVPTTTPIVITRENAKIEGPPNRTNASKTRRVVPEVIIVRPRVTFKAWFTTSVKEDFRIIFSSSRIRSKTMIVSFNEYPIMVIKAPIT